MIRRIVTVSCLTVAMVAANQAVVLADELTDHLDRHADSLYSGEQTVACNTPDGGTSEVYEVGQSNGLTVARDQAGETRVARVATQVQDLDGRYTVTAPRMSRFAGRSVDEIDVMEGDTLRLRFVFDVASGALLASDVFNADGSTYCRTRLIDFVPGDAGISAGVTYSEPDGPVLIDDVDESSLPAAVGAFERLTVAEGPSDLVTSAYYEDGAFGFTLLHSRKPIAVPELANAPAVELAQGTYQRTYDVGTAVYAWESGRGGYVLAGDLPLDMQLGILEELPAPEPVSVFRRIWRNLFD